MRPNRSFQNMTKFKYLGTSATIKTVFTKKLRADELAKCLLLLDSEFVFFPSILYKVND